jgi:hypothetical protein
MSSTGNFTSGYIRHTYKVKSELKSYTVYALSKSEGNVNLLTDILRIEQFQGKFQTIRVDYYLRLRTDPKSWTRSQLVTGLRPTSNKSLFGGNRKPIVINITEKNPLIFLFSIHKQILFTNVYRVFYPIHNVIT